jgi:hypothetical protein
MDDELIRLRMHVEKLQRENAEKYSAILALNKQNEELKTENFKLKPLSPLKTNKSSNEENPEILFRLETMNQGTSSAFHTSRNSAVNLGRLLAMKGAEYQVKIDAMRRMFEGKFEYKESPHSLVNISRWELVIVCPNPDNRNLRSKINKEEAVKYFHKGFRPEFSKKIKQLRINQIVENKAFEEVYETLNSGSKEEKMFSNGLRFFTDEFGTVDKCTPPKDYLSLMRNVLLVKLGIHLGLHTKQVISNNGKYIYILVCADEQDLQNEAESTNYNLQMEIGEIDLPSLEPVDNNLRPLRVLDFEDEEIKHYHQTISKEFPETVDLLKLSENEDSKYSHEGITEAIKSTYKLYLGYLLQGLRTLTKSELTGNSKNIFLQKLLQNCIEKANQGKIKEARIQNLWSKIGFEKPLSPYLDYFRKIDPDTKKCKYEHMWKKYETQGFRTRSIFSSIDRIKLLLSMIKKEVNIDYLVEKEVLTAFFPLKNNYDLIGEKMYTGVLDDLNYQDKTKSYLKEALGGDFYEPSVKGITQNWESKFYSHQLPLNKIRNYFGEKIAFYFAFISFFSKIVSIPSIFGLVVFILQRIYEPDSPLIIIINLLFCIYSSIWATIFIEYWKRKENCLAIRWGTTDFEEDEVPRPQFLGEPKRSPIDDDMDDIYFNPRSRYKYFLLSTIVTGIFITIVIVAVLFLIYLRTNITNTLLFKGFDLAGPVVSSLNAVQIQILNLIFNKVAIKLTNLENHRTQSDYENSLILKCYVFQFINSFFSLFYISFFKTNIEGCMVWKGTTKKEQIKGESCADELYIQFITIFILSFFRNIIELGIPFVTALKNSQELKGKVKNIELIPTDITKLRNQIDSQFALPPYITRDVDGTLGDYLEVSILYGYITLFAVAFPLSGALAFISIAVEIQVDRFKLLNLVRRPIPIGAKNISSWKTIFVFNSITSIVTNSALICFTLPTFKNFDLAERNKFLIFSIFCLIMLGVRSFIAFAIPDIPMKYDVISKRHRKIAQRFIKGWEIIDTKDDSRKVYVNPEIYCTTRLSEDP